MKNKAFLYLVVITMVFEVFSLVYPTFSLAANLTSVKNTLQSSRLSFSGRVKAPTATGGSTVYIYSAASNNFTSISTAGLKPGDSLTIGTGTYTIGSIIDATTFTVTPVLLAGDSTDTAAIYFRAKPQQVITFTTPSAVAAGFFQVLIPASVTYDANDLVPDTAGFDLGGGNVTLTPTNTTGYTFVGAYSEATASGTGTCTAGYHCFEFHYTGNGAIGANISLAIGTTGYTDNVLAPAPLATRIANTADSYKFYVKNFTNASNPSSATPIDYSTGTIAFIEGVRVTATVDPSITFKIEGTATGAHCGLTTDVATTSYAVPFGVLALDTFKIAAQKLTVSTNANSGYSVTAIENERMSNLAAVPKYIPNTACDSGTPCTQSGAGGIWATEAGNPGFGYTLAVIANSPTVAPIAASFRRFASLAATEAPVEIMSSPGIASTQTADVCYQISVDATQPAGEYENQITYTATASF